MTNILNNMGFTNAKGGFIANDNFSFDDSLADQSFGGIKAQNDLSYQGYGDSADVSAIIGVDINSDGKIAAEETFYAMDQEGSDEIGEIRDRNGYLVGNFDYNGNIILDVDGDLSADVKGSYNADGSIKLTGQIENKEEVQQFLNKDYGLDIDLPSDESDIEILKDMFNGAQTSSFEKLGDSDKKILIDTILSDPGLIDQFTPEMINTAVWCLTDGSLDKKSPIENGDGFISLLLEKASSTLKDGNYSEFNDYFQDIQKSCINTLTQSVEIFDPTISIPINGDSISTIVKDGFFQLENVDLNQDIGISYSTEFRDVFIKLEPIAVDDSGKAVFQLPPLTDVGKYTIFQGNIKEGATFKDGKLDFYENSAVEETSTTNIATVDIVDQGSKKLNSLISTFMKSAYLEADIPEDVQENSAKITVTGYKAIDQSDFNPQINMETRPIGDITVEISNPDGTKESCDGKLFRKKDWDGSLSFKLKYGPYGLGLGDISEDSFFADGL